MVLKGHISVANTNLKNFNIGKEIDNRARKFLKKEGLNYNHGTGHGVGFFLNVHEGPQSLSKYNIVKLREGMVLSNEPGYYKKGHYGIRIENLVYIKKHKNNCLQGINRYRILDPIINKDINGGKKKDEPYKKTWPSTSDASLTSVCGKWLCQKSDYEYKFWGC